MSDFQLVLRFPSGSVLVGGHSPAPDGTSVGHARLPDDRPFIPASALRGALRESLEMLLRGVDAPACAGGNGVDPRAPAAASGPCQLADGQPCRSCRLFGGGRPRLPDGARTFSALVLGEAIPSRERAIAWQVRHGVAIDRRRRSASTGLLFRRAVPEEGLEFRAHGRLIGADDQLRRDFEAAVKATTHLGAGKSGGLARVEMQLSWSEPEVAPRSVPPDGDVEIAVVLRTPAAIGVPLSIGNFRDTRHEIPGSALRGAIGFALAEILEDPGEPGFQALVKDDESGAIFDFLYAVDDASGTGLAAPWPLTARRCKADPRHGTVDVLVDRLALDAVRTPAEAERLEELLRESCPDCRNALRSPPGGRRAHRAPPVRLATRVAMDRRRGSAADKALFSLAMLERGARFVGRIRNIPEAGRERLALALAQPLSVGRGRAMGWGALQLDGVTTPPRPAPLEERGTAFEQTLRRRLESLGLPWDREGRLVPLTLLSPLIPSEAGDDGRAVLAAALGGVARWPVVARRFELERGWDQRTGPRSVARAVRAGAVFVAELPERADWRHISDALAHLEAQGAGERTRQGFGRVLCFDPFISERTRSRDAR